MALSLDEIVAAAATEELKNPDGSDIITEDQLIAAREAKVAASADDAEDEQPQEEDTLLKVIQDSLTPPEAPDAEAAEEEVVDTAVQATELRATNIAKLKEWGVTVSADATDEWLITEFAKGKPAAPAAAPKRKKFSVTTKKADAEVVETHVEEPPAPAAVVPTLTEDDRQYIAGLTQEQKDELHEAEVVEMLEPAKYKDQKKKLLAFYRRFDTETQQIASSKPEETKLEDTPEFQSLVKAKPNLPGPDYKRVQRKIAKDEFDAESKPKMDELEMNQRRIELKPKFQEFANTTFKNGVDELLVETATIATVSEAVKLIKEKGITEAKKEFPLEAGVYERETKNFSRRVEQFLLLKNRAVTYDPANPDPDQAYVLSFIQREGRMFAEKGGKYLVQNGRKFLARADFINVIRTNQQESSALDKKSWTTKSFWTFTDGQIVDFLAQNAKDSIEYLVKTAETQATSFGFDRRKKNGTTPATNPKTPATELNPPRATPRAGAGPATPPATPVTQADGVDVISTMYPHLKKR